MLFGSYAKGTADGRSDIDICFSLNNYVGKRRMDILKIYFDSCTTTRAFILSQLSLGPLS